MAVRGVAGQARAVHDDRPPLGTLDGTAHPLFAPVVSYFGQLFHARSRGGGALAIRAARPARGRRVGGVRRPTPVAALGARHRHHLLLDHQGPGLHRRPPPGRSRPRRLRGAGGELLARVRRGGQARHHGAPAAQPPGRPALDGGSGTAPRGPARSHRPRRPPGGPARRPVAGTPRGTTPSPTGGWWPAWPAGSPGSAWPSWCGRSSPAPWPPMACPSGHPPRASATTRRCWAGPRPCASPRLFASASARSMPTLRKVEATRRFLEALYVPYFDQVLSGPEPLVLAPRCRR